MLICYDSLKVLFKMYDFQECHAQAMVMIDGWHCIVHVFVTTGCELVNVSAFFETLSLTEI